jgi:UDP-N-acetylmuramate: L-alanyl-gamma-D-glutamyl-meso-diaminopimelate ligase
MRIHIVAVSGTGMGSLAGLLRELGHDVSGSDASFDPPMGPALEAWGVRCLRGFDPAHLSPAPDLVVVGNVCRPDNPEARAAIDGGLPTTHIAGALGRFALDAASPLVVAGTHGKTTTTALAAHLLDRVGMAPGFLIGGLPRNFPRSFRAAGPRRLSLEPGPGRRTPFVIEGDEYDTAFFEKTPKFWHYRPEVAIITSIEHDHIDIYPTLDAYVAAFRHFVELVPESGLIVANGADPIVRDVVAKARAEVAYFALHGEDTGHAAPHWLAAPAASGPDGQTFDLFAGGVACGRFALAVPGRHNLKNALAAIGATAQGYGARLADLGPALASFEGVRRRQELLGTPGGISVYDDFAHHPSAVRETLAALRSRHPKGKLIAVFEPRSATACRKLHQDEYPGAFAAADIVFFAPLGRTNLPPAEALDLDAITRAITQAGRHAERFNALDEIPPRLAEVAQAGDVIALLSNGAFGGLQSIVLERLADGAKRA